MEDSAADMAMPRKSSKPLTPGGPGLKDPFAGNVKESAPLKAGATDDNADYASYLRFLASWTGREDVRGCSRWRRVRSPTVVRPRPARAHQRARP